MSAPDVDLLDNVAGRVLSSVEVANLEMLYEVQGAAAIAEAIGARTEVQYPLPGSRERCDIVIGDDGPGVWIEVKYAWTWTTYRRPNQRNPAYDKHLLCETGASALVDARDKLPRLLDCHEVAAFGFLLLALDSTILSLHMDDIGSLEERAGLDRPPWRRFDRERRDSRVYPSVRVQPFLWLRLAKSNA